MTTLDEQISSAIRENLPEKVGVELQGQLSKLAKLEEDHASLLDKHNKLSIELNEKKVLIEQKDNSIKALESQLQDQQEFEEEKRNLKITMLEHKNATMHDNMNAMNNHTALLLRNTEFRKDYHEKTLIARTGFVSDSNGFQNEVMLGQDEHMEPLTETNTAE